MHKVKPDFAQATLYFLKKEMPKAYACTWFAYVSFQVIPIRLESY